MLPGGGYGFFVNKNFAQFVQLLVGKNSLFVK